MNLLTTETLTLVATHAVSAAVLALFVALISSKIRHASVVHALWVMVLLKLLTPPVFELAVLPASPAPSLPQLAINSPRLVPTVLPSPDAPISDSVATTLAPIAIGKTKAIAWETLVLALLASGTLIVLLLSGWRLRRFHRLLEDAGEPPRALVARVEELAGVLGLRKPPRLRLVRGRVSPMVWPRFGVVELVLPTALVKSLQGAELDAVVAHELAHLKRRDHWVRFLELTATALFWWHPVLWWARRNLRRSEERCCDLWVAHALPGRARAYAEGLLKTLELLAGAPTPLPATGTGMNVQHDMKERLTMILTERTPKILTTRNRWLLATAAVAVLLIVPTRAPRAAGPAGDEASASGMLAEEQRFEEQRLQLERREMSLQEQMRALEMERQQLDFDREMHQRDIELDHLDQEAQRLESAGEATAAKELRQQRHLQEAEFELARQQHDLEREALEQIVPLENELHGVLLRRQELELHGEHQAAEALEDEARDGKRRLHELMTAHEQQRAELEEARIAQHLQRLTDRHQALLDAGHTEDAAQVEHELEYLRAESAMATLQGQRSAKEAAYEHQLAEQYEALHAAEAAGDQERARAQEMKLQKMELQARERMQEFSEAQIQFERQAQREKLKAHMVEMKRRYMNSADDKKQIELKMRELKEELARIESERQDE